MKLLDEVERSLAEGLLPPQVFNDPEVYALEKERIFLKCWLFVGHESEIPQPGDYVLRYLGEDPFILARDELGEIRVMLNMCRHRGTQVCRAEVGNTSHFRCPYHGWSYRNDGRLVGVPQARDTAQGLDKEEWGLVPAPHVANYHGLIFASLDPDAEPFEDYLAEMKFYLDIFFKLNDDLEVIGPPNRWVLDANWKIASENFGIDDYHLIYLHKSMYDMGAMTGTLSEMIRGQHISTRNGHAMGASFESSEDSFWEFPDEVVARYDLDQLDEVEAKLARGAHDYVGNIFPNTSFLIITLNQPGVTEQPVTLVNLKVWQPRGHDRMELWNWTLVPKGASDEFKRASHEVAVATFSSAAGLFEQDDTEPFTTITSNAGSAFVRQAGVRLNYQSGMSIGTALPMDDWPGPGTVYSHRFEEGCQRAGYAQWLKLMKQG
jgi:phenylpropionate dioxygenase-like ring-hydroxylating dioxygenase large terminal subunit